MLRSLRRTFFRPERPTLTSRSLQSIARPFQKRFQEVFGNAWILIFYLSIKAWEEKFLPKSHLGWFFLVFGEGKATKENMSIFWFIWPLKNGNAQGRLTINIVSFDRAPHFWVDSGLITVRLSRLPFHHHHHDFIKVSEYGT